MPETGKGRLGSDGRRASAAQPPTEVAPRNEVVSLVRRLSAEGLDRRSRLGLVRRLTAALRASARTAGTAAVTRGRWLVDLVDDLAPHVKVRDRAQLEATYGLTGDALAETLTRSASRATATVGAAGGALSAAESLAPPTLLGVPAQLVAETLAVVGIELRLVGELHEALGISVPSSPRERATMLIVAWVRRRGIDPLRGGFALGVAARRELRKRLLRRLTGSLSTLAPFLAGAVAGAELNRRETVKLGEHVVADLRKRLPPPPPVPPVRPPGRSAPRSAPY